MMRPLARQACARCRPLRLLVVGVLLVLATPGLAADAPAPRKLDASYRPPPIWGCEEGLSPGAFHVVVATFAPEPNALVPWIWSLGLTGAHVWIYHRLEPNDPRLAAAAAVLSSFEPYPCGMKVLLQPLLPNKGREAAVYLTHIVKHYAALPEAMVLVHDHGPAARHSLCGPFFRRVRGYYIGIRELLKAAGGGSAALASTASSSSNSSSSNSSSGGAGGAGAGLPQGSGAGMGAEAGAGAGAAGVRRSLAASRKRSKGGSSSSKRLKMLAAFANMTVSLSSGCQENWLKGCCALLVCAEDGEQPDMGLEDPEGFAGGSRMRAMRAQAQAQKEARQREQQGLQQTLAQGLQSWQSGDGTARADAAAAGGAAATGGEGPGGAGAGNASVVGPLGVGRLLLQTAVGGQGLDAGAGEPLLGQDWGDGYDGAEEAGEGDEQLRLEAYRPGMQLLQAAGGGGQQGAGTTDALKRWPGRTVQRGRCPFRTSKCLANGSALAAPVSGVAGMGKYLYMHGGGGLYDTRYENLVTLYGETPEAAAEEALGGHSNVGFGPLSLVKYGGPKSVETVRGAASSSRSLDYPEGGAQRTKEQTYAALGEVLAGYGFAEKKTPGNFKSCCASLMLRPHAVRHWPLAMYEQVLAYTLDERNTYHASLAVSHHGWAMWGGSSEVGPSDLLRYFEVDLALLSIRGCPGWRMVPG